MKVKFVGSSRSTVRFLEYVDPGEVYEVEDEVGEILLRGLFIEVDEKVTPKPKKVKGKKLDVQDVQKNKGVE